MLFRSLRISLYVRHYDLTIQLFIFLHSNYFCTTVLLSLLQIISTIHLYPFCSHGDLERQANALKTASPGSSVFLDVHDLTTQNVILSFLHRIPALSAANNFDHPFVSVLLTRRSGTSGECAKEGKSQVFVFSTFSACMT